MAAALAAARQGMSAGEVPIGAVAVRDNLIVARGHNRRNSLLDITAHAEMSCLRDLSSRQFDFDLSDITVYSTLEPCAMCLGAMIHYKIGRIVFGEYDLIAGACGSKYEFHKIAGVNVVSGIYRAPCRQILLDYFKSQLGHESVRWNDIELPGK